MKQPYLIKLLLLLLMPACYLSICRAQVTTEMLRSFCAADDKIDAEIFTEFYSKLNYHFAWVDRSACRDTFFSLLKRSADVGLNEKDYQYAYLSSFKNRLLPALQDSAEADMRISDAAIHYCRDLFFGNSIPVLGYNGLKYRPNCLPVATALAQAITKNDIHSMLDKPVSSLPETGGLEQKIQWFNKVIRDSGFREITISSKKVDRSNQALTGKLYQLGIIDNTVQFSDSLIKEKLKTAQRSFVLLADGVLRSTILEALNVPVKTRLQQLILALNYYRWLNCLTQQQAVIVVNIPAAYLKVYDRGSTILEMRIIAGKPSTPTPTLASTIDEVILYPYWHVPYSIATKELLPLIKRNPGFIDAGNYQVLNMKGKIMNPRSINWRSLSSRYFPYIIRQSTGCDNALGLLKLNFYSPFGVYLHDTPGKALFMLNKRFFSHGCMRMEKPVELGHLLLNRNAVAIDTLEQKGCLLHQAPVIVPADTRMPVIVWYNPAGIDAGGLVLFYEDVYKKFNWK